MVIRNEVEALALLLEFDCGFHRPEVISYMQFPAWLQSRQNSHKRNFAALCDLLKFKV
jgi:hypothetical protein